MCVKLYMLVYTDVFQGNGYKDEGDSKYSVDKL